MLRRIAHWVALALAALVLLGTVLVRSVFTDPGRKVLCNVLNAQLGTAFRGQLHIAKIDELHWNQRLKATGVTLRDPEGRLVVTGGEIVINPVRQLASGLWRGLRNRPRAWMPEVLVHLHTVHLYPGQQGIPSIAEALSSPKPKLPTNAPTPPGPPLLFPRIEVAIDRVENHLGNFESAATSVQLHGRLNADPLALVIESAQTEFTSARTPLINVHASFQWQSHFVYPPPLYVATDIGSTRAALDATGREVECHLAYDKTGTTTRATVSDCRVGESVLDQIAAKPLGMDAALDALEVTQQGAGPYHVVANGSVNAQPFATDVTLSENDLVADLSVHRLDLARIRADLSPSQITGTIHLERHGPRWILDTHRLRAHVQSVEVPPVEAVADVRGKHVVLEKLVSDPIGLRARGEVELSTTPPRGFGEVHLHTGDISRLPYPGPRGRAHGSVDLDAHIDNRRGNLSGKLDARVKSLRAAGARVDTAQIHAALTTEHNTPVLLAQIHASGAAASGYGPVAIDARMAGNPERELSGDIQVDGTAPVPEGGVARLAFRGPFETQINPDAITVRLPNAAVVLRGAAGTLSGYARIPRSKGAMSASATIITQDGGRADVTVYSTKIRGRFDAFPVAWAARAAGVSYPLAGTLAGDLDLLTNRASASRGTIRWTAGRLPYLGEFDLDVTADHTQSVSSFEALLKTRGPKVQTIRAALHAVPPADLGNGPAWLHGLRNVDIAVNDLSLQDFNQVLPTGMVLAGTVNARVIADRQSPSAPLAVRAGINVRGGQLGRDVAGDQIPGALRSRVRPGTRVIRPLTAPLRLRGTVCTTLSREGLPSGPLAADMALGREVGEARSEPETTCDQQPPEGTGQVALVQDPIVQAHVGLQGPWLAATAAALREYSAVVAGPGMRPVALQTRSSDRSRLAATHANVRLQLGPIDTTRWPFSQQASAIAPALAPPPFAARGTITFALNGSLASPTVLLDGQTQMGDQPSIVGQDETSATVHVRLAPSQPNGILFDQATLEADARGNLTLHNGSRTENGGTVSARLALEGALARLLNPQPNHVSLARNYFELTATDFALGRLVWAQKQGLDGRVTFHARHGDNPSVLLVADGNIANLRARGLSPVGAWLSARVARDNSGEWVLRACTEIDASTDHSVACRLDTAPSTTPRGGLLANVTVPLGASAVHLTPRIDGIVATITADDVRLEPISPFLQGTSLTQLGGALRAQLSWRGASVREVHGSVHFHDGIVGLETIGTPATGVTLDITDDGRHVQLERLALQLGPGTLTATGTADVQPQGPLIARAELNATTNRLLVTQEGNDYGLLTSHFNVNTTVHKDRLAAHVRVRSARLIMPGQPTHAVQDLVPDPNIVVLGRAQPGAETSSGYPVYLELTTDRPFVVTRNDLYLAVRSALRLRNGPSGLFVGGDVELALRQSWFDLLGKRFYFDRATVNFRGGTEIDPALDVLAHYDSASTGRINVRVAGRPSAPDITFTSELYPSADQSEVLSMLVLGRRDTRGPGEQQSVATQAENAIAGALVGFGAGQLTNAVRQRFGVPLQIIAEPGNEGLASGRYGAGATALQGRLYVEGTFGTATSYGGALNSVALQGGTSAQEFHGLVEYSLSPKWSVSGQFGTSNHFGGDIFWLPFQ